MQLVKSQDTLQGERNAEPIVGATIKVIIALSSPRTPSRGRGTPIVWANIKVIIVKS